MIKGDKNVESAVATPELSVNKMVSKIPTLGPASARTNGEGEAAGDPRYMKFNLTLGL